MLRKIFGPKREEVTGEWRRLHSEKINDLHFLLNIIQVIKSIRMRLVRANDMVGERRSAYRILVGKPEVKGTLGRPRCRLEDCNKINLCDVVWEGGMDWVVLAQDRDRWWTLGIALMNHWIP